MADRALMFVHRGMDVENQWERAVTALGDMSNLEIALVWRRMSEAVPVDDFKMHSEYKCLFKRAVRDAEGMRVVEFGGLGHKLHGHAHGFNEAGSDGGSVQYEYTNFSDPRRPERISRESSGISVQSGPVYTEEEKSEMYLKHQAVIQENDDMDETSRKEYFDRLIDKITKDTMNPGMRKALLEKIAAYK